MSTFEPQPWLRVALERLETRRGERLLVLLVDVPACLTALRRAIGSTGELLAVVTEALVAETLRTLPDIEVLAYEPQGSERFGTFDAVLLGPAVAPRQDASAWGELLPRNLRPGGRFVLVEFHPAAMIFDEKWQLKWPYSTGGEPLVMPGGVRDYVGISGATLAPSGVTDGERDFQNPHAMQFGAGGEVIDVTRTAYQPVSQQDEE